MSWYRLGTISCTLNSNAITGSGTLFKSQVSPSDVFFGPDGEIYEIVSVVDDTHITIKSATSSAVGYKGANVSGSSNYAIIHAFAGLSNADLAKKVANLLNSWQVNEDQYAGWIGGTALGGGLDSNGTGAILTNGLVSNTTGGAGFYPLTDSQGNTSWVKCPAAINNTIVPATNNCIVTTSDWRDSVIGIELGALGNVFAGSNAGNHIYSLTNAKFSTNWQRFLEGIATKYEQKHYGGAFCWSVGSSGAANSIINWSSLMELSSTGSLLVNGAVDDGVTKLIVNGNIKGNTFTGSVSGNASSCTKLQTARTINGVSFDGTTNISITDSSKEPTISAGVSGQYWRGDKTWQTLNAASVGLGNVTNESKATMFTSPTFTTSATAPYFVSTVTASAPLTVASTIKVSNLNADMVEGFHASQTPGNGIIVVSDGAGIVKLNSAAFITSYPSTPAANNTLVDFYGGARFISTGPSASTYSPIMFHQKSSNGTLFRDAVIVDANANMKICVGKLLVGNPTSTGSYAGQLLQIKQADTNYGGIKIEKRTDESMLCIGHDETSDSFVFSANFATTGGYKSIAFFTGGAERVRIGAAGNILIGPSVDNGVDKLQVTGSANFTGALKLGNVTDSNATALDWYEEGTWTPTGNNVTLTNSTSKWTRIGDVVVVTSQVTWPTTTNTDGVQINGLPFIVKGSAGAAVGYSDSTVKFRLFAEGNYTIYGYDDNGAFMTNSQLSGKTIRFTLVYHC